MDIKKHFLFDFQMNHLLWFHCTSDCLDIYYLENQKSKIFCLSLKACSRLLIILSQTTSVLAAQ